MSGCDCSRCQTEGCVANTYCHCCLKAERDVLRAQIERVRELCEQQAFPLNDVPTMAVTVTQILRALEEADDAQTDEEILGMTDNDVLNQTPGRRRR